MIIEWRKVLSGNYEVSNTGRVRRATAGKRTWIGREMKRIKMKIGYLAVAPTVNGKNVTTYVHRLVAEAFLGPCKDGFEVNHKDGNKANPRLDNLEYVSHAMNMNHASGSNLLQKGDKHVGCKISFENIKTARSLHKSGSGTCSLARKFGISPSTMSMILNDKRRKTA